MDDKIILNVKVRQKIASLVNKDEYIVCGNDNYAIKFDFDDDFAGYKFKTAIFISQDDKVTEEVIFEGDTCDIPPIYNSKVVSVGVVADNVRTTTPAIVACKLSISDLAGKITPPSEDVYNQIMALLNQYIDKAVVTEEEVKQFVEEFLEGYEDIVTEAELADAVASVMAKINEQADDIKELESISTVIVEGVSALEEDVADIDDRVSYLESFNLDYTEVSSDTGIVQTPNNEFVGKKAFLNFFGGMTYKQKSNVNQGYAVLIDETYGASVTINTNFFAANSDFYYLSNIPADLRDGVLYVNTSNSTAAQIGTTSTGYYFRLDYNDTVTSLVIEKTTLTTPIPNIYPTLSYNDPDQISHDVDIANYGYELVDTKPTEIKVHGANLIKSPYHEGKPGTTKQMCGVTFTVNAEGTITVNGTATPTSTAPSGNAIFDIVQAWSESDIKAGSYYLSGCPQGGSSSGYYVTIALKNADDMFMVNAMEIGNGRAFTLASDVVKQYIRITVSKGTTVNNLVFKPMLNIGTTALPYTPYKEPVTLPIPDAIQNLPDYGKGVDKDYYNKINLEEQTYTERVTTIVLDGVTNKFLSTGLTTDGTDRRWFSSTSIQKPMGSSTLICSHLKAAHTSESLNAGIIYLAGTAPNNRCYAVLQNQSIETVDEANTWLQEQNAIGNPVTVTYAKAKEATTITSLPVTLDGLVEVERGGFIEIVTDTGKGVPASATFVIPRE